MLLSVDVVLFYFVFCYVFVLMDGFNIDVKGTVMLRGNVDPGSYFGYSVGIGKSAGDRRILIGAPRSEDPSMSDVSRPGAIFLCIPPWTKNTTCTKLDIDSNTGLETVTFAGRSVTFRHGKNDSWLGGSIDVYTSGTSDVFATCAHKWYNDTFFANERNFYMQGICYEIPLDLNMANVKKLPALENDELTRKTFNFKERNKTVWNYGLGGVGISVHYTKDGNNLLLGAAGLLDWIGGFVNLEGNKVKVMENNINSTNIIRPYLGYSATSGSYFSDKLTYFVFGAPRAEMRGVVMFFKAGENKYTYQNSAKILEGSLDGQTLPANSYFGATLCTVDVNNDNFDDLLVAAPLYSPFTDEGFTKELELGLVFVYLGSSNSLAFQSPPQTLKGTKANGRFGSAIANVGDINSDSFADIAVGAPYEMDLKGAVYIYNGYTQGVWPKYSQRILASDLDTGLRGFGISISSGKDVNEDNINDLVIGSYLSDLALIMFGQPVISVDAQMKFINSQGAETQFIEIGKSKKETVTVCFRYDYRHCSYTRFRVTIRLDTEMESQPRINFAKTKEASITSTIKVFSGDRQCTPDEEILTKSTSDLVSEIMIMANYAVEEISCPGLRVSATISHFNGASPGDAILQLRKQLQFKNDCPNNLCKTNLTLQAEAKYENIGGYFVIGKRDLFIDVQITKTGDASYASVFYIFYPIYISYKSMKKFDGETEISCSPIDSNNNNTAIISKDDESALSCLFGNPMKNDSGVSFRLFMNVPTSVENDDTSMVLRMFVDTLSEELEPADNNQTITINLMHNLEATFLAISKHEQIYLEDKKNTYNMEDIYDFHNKGPSLLKSAVLNMSFPQIQQSGKALLSLNRITIRCGQTCEAKCDIMQSQTTPTIYIYFKGILALQTKEPTTPLPDVQNTDCREKMCALLICTMTNIQAKTSVVVDFQFFIDKEIERVFKVGKM